MNVDWNVKRDLDLLARIVNRELATRHSDERLGMAAAFKFEPRENNPRVADISLPVKIPRGIEVHLTSAVSTFRLTIDDLVGLAKRFADAVEKVYDQKSELIASRDALRSHLRKRIRALRTRGLRIDGDVGIGSVELDEADDIAPVVTLRFPGDDLRPSTIWFIPEEFADIDREIAELRGTVRDRSRRLDDLEAVGAAGYIDPIFAHAITHCEGGTAATIKRILANEAPFQDISDRKGRKLIAYWQRGMMTGTVPVADGVRLVSGRLEFSKLARPTTDILIGAPVTSIIDMPALADLDSKILSVSERLNDGISVAFVIEPLLYDSDGAIL